MQTDREDPPISSKPRPTADHDLAPISLRDDGEPVSMSDIEMILAPGIAPPPLPAAAREQGNGAKNAAKDVAEGGVSKWSSDAPALRRRRERSSALQAPDAVFQDIRFGAPKDHGEHDKEAEAARKSSPEVSLATNDQSAADLALMAALSPPVAAKPVIEEDVALDLQDAGPPSGLLDVRNMIAMLEPSTDKKAVDDDFLNLSGGILDLDPSASIFSPMPPPVDDGPRADEEEVLSLPDPPSEEKRLLAPVLPLPDEKAVAAEPEGMGLLGEAVARSAKKRESSADKARAKSSTKKKAVAAAPTPAAPAPETSKSRLPWIVAIGAVCVALFVLWRDKEPAPAPPAPTTPAATAHEVETAPVAPVATPAPTVEPAATPTAVDPGTPPPSTATAADPAKTAAAAPTAPKPESTTTATAKPTAAAATAAPTAANTPAPAATPAPTQAPAASGREFNKGEASAALSSAAGSASGCRAADDPSGTARVSVTFAPSGRVTSALINGPPFAGTPTGGCIARAFRGVSISAFDGGPVTVSKSFSIR